MTNTTIKIIDGNNDETLRPMNKIEQDNYESIMQENALRESERQAKETQRLALFERLGITADEAKLLLS
jgi:hypothetical protein